MKGNKPKVISWRALVGGEQIGSGYPSEKDALEAAQEFIKNDPNSRLSPIAMPSSMPVPIPD